MLSPDNEVVWHFDGDFDSKSENPDNKQSTVINFLLKNIRFEKIGIYKIEAKIDQQLKNTFSFPVTVQKDERNG